MILWVFGVREYNGILIFVIRGQFHPKRSPKGHLKVIGGCFSGLAPFYDLLINSRMILENIYGLRRKKIFTNMVQFLTFGLFFNDLRFFLNLRNLLV